MIARVRTRAEPSGGPNRLVGRGQHLGEGHCAAPVGLAPASQLASACAGSISASSSRQSHDPSRPDGPCGTREDEDDVRFDSRLSLLTIAFRPPGGAREAFVREFTLTLTIC